MKIKHLKFIVSAALCLIGAADVLAKPPVVIEMFGVNECTTDALSQEDILNVMRKEENVLLINCRKSFEREDADHKFTHQFCNDRSREYTDRISFGMYRMPTVIVNGRWEANFENVGPAVGMGYLDKVSPIDLTLNQGFLNISFSKLEAKHEGVILVYAYMPTQGKKSVLVDPDLELTEDIKRKIDAGQSVPFVTEVKLSSFYLKPVIAKERIGSWSGDELHLTYPLHDINAMASSDVQELSYVVVVHKGNETGEILAAGEYTSSAETKMFNNQGRSPEIERHSNPVTWSDPQQ